MRDNIYIYIVYFTHVSVRNQTLVSVAEKKCLNDINFLLLTLLSSTDTLVLSVSNTFDIFFSLTFWLLTLLGLTDTCLTDTCLTDTFV